MSPPLRPAVRALLREAGELPAPSDLTVAGLRSHSDAHVIGLHAQVRPAPGVLAEDLVSPGGVPVRLYRSQGAGVTGAVHIHLHGGGWWMGSIQTADAMARELAGGLGMSVLSVDYRLAPEHPWPAAAEDTYEVLSWLAGTYDSISVGGESAGANLAAVVALMARDRGGPRLVAQWLDVPAVDLRLPEDESMRLYGTGFGLERVQLPMIVDWYGADPTHPYVSPLLADLRDLPPAIVTTAECDPLRDQGEAYASALATAGVPVDLRRAQGHVHGSAWLTALDEETGAWHDDVVACLGRLHALAVAR